MPSTNNFDTIDSPRIESTTSSPSIARRVLTLVISIAVVGAIVGVVSVASGRDITTTLTQSRALAETPNLPDTITKLLQDNKPTLSLLVEKNFPATLGKCDEMNAPKPCSEMGYLYQEKATFYKALARWVTGLNKIRFDQVEFTSSKDGVMTFQLKANFAALPASLRIESCLGTLCSKVVDDTKTCCGTDKTLTIVATAKCNEAYPFVRDLTLQTASITPIIVEVNILGQHVKKDLTPSLIAKIKELLPTKGLEYLNSKLKENLGDKVICTPTLSYPPLGQLEESTSAVNLPQAIIAALQQNKPTLSQLVKENVPASVGKCTEKNPPAPCKEMGYLYQEKGSNYKALARWVSGINIIRFDQVDLTAAKNGSLQLKLKANFASLPASLRIDGCLGSLCSNIVDDTKTCCGNDKTVTVVAQAECSPTYPFIRNITFTTATITPIIVQVNVLGQTIKKDLTPAIEAKFKDFVTTTGLDYANAKFKETYGETVECVQ